MSGLNGQKCRPLRKAGLCRSAAPEALLAERDAAAGEYGDPARQELEIFFGG